MGKQRISRESETLGGGKRLIFHSEDVGTDGARRLSTSEDKCCCPEDCLCPSRLCPGEPPLQPTRPPCFPCEQVSGPFTFEWNGACYYVIPCRVGEGTDPDRCPIILDVADVEIFPNCAVCVDGPGSESVSESVSSSSSGGCWRVPTICACSGAQEPGATNPVVPCSHTLDEDPCIFEHDGDCYTATMDDPRVYALDPNDEEVIPNCTFDDCPECCGCNTCQTYCGTCSDPPNPVTDAPACGCNDSYEIIISMLDQCPCGDNFCHGPGTAVCCDLADMITLQVDRPAAGPSCRWDHDGVNTNFGSTCGCPIIIDSAAYIQCTTVTTSCNNTPDPANEWYIRVIWTSKEYTVATCACDFQNCNGEEGISAYRTIGDPCSCPEGVYTTCDCEPCTCPACDNSCTSGYNCGMVVVV